MKDIANAKLLRSSHFKDVESLCQKIIASENTKLQIPNSLTFSGAFGMEGAVLQLLATWIRHSQTHIIHTAIQEKDHTKSFENLCNSLFGLCALRLSDEIWSSKKERISMVEALRPASPIFYNIRKENFKDAFKGMYLAIPAIKAPVVGKSTSREFDSPLYSGEEVASARKMYEITKNALKAIVPKISRHAEVDLSVVDHLSEIIRELFSNTHRHARHDVNGNIYKKNFRGVIFNSSNLSASRLTELVKAGGGDLMFFIRDSRPKDGENFKIIEITVIDSGPGFARRWKGLQQDKLDFELEKEAIVECFQKHKSTKQSESSGSGLTNVLKDLKRLRGWFRLRTGSALVERSFHRDEDNSSIRSEDIIKMPTFLEGTLINIVIPLASLLGK